jgi:predicted Zn finger-like uncharacterized protein
MSSPDLQTVVIACPNCGTRYQVPIATLGLTGREVRCAQCSKSWHALAAAEHDDSMFAAEEEKALDAAFEAAQKAEATSPQPAPAQPALPPEAEQTIEDVRAALAPKPKPPAPNPADQAKLTKSRHAFERRLEAIRNSLPLAKLRRLARIAGAIVLVLLFAIGIAGRVEIVRQFPELAGLYSALGLRVNVIGLEFENVKTLMSLRQGKNVILVTARIRSAAAASVRVPPVLVTLFGEDGNILLEWTVIPEAGEMEPGEVMDFSSEVNSPPEGAARVRLSFTTGSDTAAMTAKVS